MMYSIQELLIKGKPNYMREMTLQELLKKSSKPCTCMDTETSTHSPNPLPNAPEPELSFDNPLSIPRPVLMLDEM